MDGCRSWNSRVAPILGPMIKHGWITPLSLPSQADIAFWAVKTALVIDQFYPAARLIPDSEYPALYAAQQPLPAHLVWIAHRRDPRENLASSLKEPITEIQVPSDNPNLADLISADIGKGARIYRSPLPWAMSRSRCSGIHCPLTSSSPRDLATLGSLRGFGRVTVI